MTNLVWVVEEKRISRQQQGLSILILILLLGWGLNYLLSSQRDLGATRGGDDILVLITGEVKNPGVYGFDRGPSVRELISRAGGLTGKLTDGEGDGYPHLAHGTKVEISSKNGAMRVSTGPMPAAYRVTLKVPLSINTAGEQELAAIPGIGPSLAKRIIHHRSLYGPFRTAEEIRAVPGIGRRCYLKIRPYIGP
jgi:competence protein ComEA